MGGKNSGSSQTYAGGGEPWRASYNSWVQGGGPQGIVESVKNPQRSYGGDGPNGSAGSPDGFGSSDAGTGGSGAGFGFGPAAAGMAFGAAVSSVTGPVAGHFAGEAVESSIREGWMGDFSNTRRDEAARDALEDKGVSRKDTALASKHGILGEDDTGMSTLGDEGGGGADSGSSGNDGSGAGGATGGDKDGGRY